MARDGEHHDEPAEDEGPDAGRKSGEERDATADAEADGGTDWLLQQLSGGREGHGADAPSEPAGENAANPDSAPPSTVSPKLRWSWETGTVEPIGSAEAPADEPAEAPAPPAPSAPSAPSAPAGSEPTRIEPTTGESATFNWALTPTDEVDPLVAVTQPTQPPPPIAERADATAPITEPVVPAHDDYFYPALPIPAAEPDATPTVAIPASQDVPGSADLPTESLTPIAAESAVLPPTSQRADDRSARRTMAATGSTTGGGPNKRTTRILSWVAGGLLVVLVLIGLYIFGTQIPGFVGAAPTPTPTATKIPTSTPTPTPTAVATGPQAPGVHAWDTLRGGECLEPFSSPWALKFTVVDCAAPHAAQLVYTNVFSADPAAAFPGEAQLASQINLLCTKPGIINLDAAAPFTDAQIQGAYPATEKQWKSGQRSYFCFVNRAGGEQLTGSIAGTGPTS